MPEHSREGGGPLNVASQLHLVGGDPVRYGHPRTLLFRPYRGELRVAPEDTAAPFMDDARRSTDVSVGESLDVLLEEVDEPPFALEQREQLQSRERDGSDG